MSVRGMFRPGMRADLIPLAAGVALATSAFLPWVGVGGVALPGIPGVAALWVLGLGALSAVLATLSLITRKNSRHPLLVIGLAALRIEREPQRAGAGRWVGWAVVLLLVAGAGAGAWMWVTRDRPIEVQIATVTERPVGTQAAVLNASGYVTARRRATVSSKITGKVIEVNVEEGMAVTEGQILARLDDTTARAALALSEAQAEAARHGVQENEAHLAQGRVNHGRVAQLLKEGIVTQS